MNIISRKLAGNLCFGIAQASDGHHRVGPCFQNGGREPDNRRRLDHGASVENYFLRTRHLKPWAALPFAGTSPLINEG